MQMPSLQTPKSTKPSALTNQPDDYRTGRSSTQEGRHVGFQDSTEQHQPTDTAAEQNDASIEQQFMQLFKTLTQLPVSDAAFQLAPFTGCANNPERAEEWLEKFNHYTDFRNVRDHQKLKLFHLLMKDNAAVWLRSLPDDISQNLPRLLEAFKQNHSMTIIDKWRRINDIWSKQQSTQTVNDYVATMQDAARRAGMDQATLINPLIRGLRPEIRLHVLHSGAQTLNEVLQAARVSEAAHAADQTITDPVTALAAKVGELLTKFDNSDQKSKSVSFAQHNIESQHATFQPRSRSTSPATYASTCQPSRISTTPSPPTIRRTTSDSQDRRAVSRGGYQPPINRQYYRSPSSFQRQQQQTPQSYSTPRMPTSSYQPTTRNVFQPTSRFPGNCSNCGRAHAIGRQFCYANNLQCHNCGRTGHLARFCRSTSMSSANMRTTNSSTRPY